MQKTIWQKIKQNHLLMMIICCLIPIIIIVGFLYLFKGKELGSYWIWLIILLCPVLHIWLMKGHKHDESGGKEIVETDNKLYKCPECGLKYKEKTWAEKCQAWCQEHYSCNLEIIKHAVKE